MVLFDFHHVKKKNNVAAYCKAIKTEVPHLTIVKCSELSVEVKENSMDFV